MLKRIALRRFVFIREAEVEFGRGFCALTGETGAGKSLLADALSLLAGARPAPGMQMPG
ncbi:MAG: AAA family ATPase, partial [Betaproteobacteria bacterium]|nr:AAA family ATPase [Betaproteobacteria bacterium]